MNVINRRNHQCYRCNFSPWLQVAAEQCGWEETCLGDDSQREESQTLPLPCTDRDRKEKVGCSSYCLWMLKNFNVTDAEVEQIRTERAEQEAQQMEMQQQMAETQMAKNAAPMAKVVQDGSQ